MKKLTKRIFSLFLVVLLVTAVLPKVTPKQTTITVDASTLRNTVVSYMRSMATIKWTPKTTMNYWTQDGRKWYAGTTYTGIPYTQYGRYTNLATFKSYLNSSNVYTGPTSYADYRGNDCSSAVAYAWRSIDSAYPVQSTHYMMPSTNDAKKVVKVGSWTDTGNSETSCTSTGKTKMYAAYDQLLPGDAINDSASHIRLVVSVNKSAQTVKCIEQASYKSGSTSSWKVDVSYSYSTLYSNGYVPIRLKMLQNETVSYTLPANFQVTASSLNVRSGPSTDYSVLGALANGQIVTVSAISGDWATITYNGSTAYVSTSYLSYYGPASGGSSSSGTVKTGDMVTVSDDAVWTDGTSIPSWGRNGFQFQVGTITGNTCLLLNPEANYGVTNEIEIKYLTVVSSSGGGSSGGSSGGTTTTTVKTGDMVTLSNDAVWTSGSAVASWCLNGFQFRVGTVTGDVCEIQNPEANYGVTGEIEIKYLTVVGSSSGGSSGGSTTTSGLNGYSPSGPGNGLSVYGIDVSYFQGDINWTKVASSGKKFAIIRIGYTYSVDKSLVKDPKFEEYYSGATAAGLDVGVYYYSRATTTTKATEEAKQVMTWLNGRVLDYPVYFDMEADEQASSSLKSSNAKVVKTFCDYIQSKGYLAGMYSGEWFTDPYVDMSTITPNYETWTSNYSGLSHQYYNGKYGMFQYSSTGSVSGISGNVDLDVCYKDYPAIMEKYGLSGHTPTSGSTSTVTLPDAYQIKTSSLIMYKEASSSSTQLQTIDSASGIMLTVTAISGDYAYYTYNGISGYSPLSSLKYAGLTLKNNPVEKFGYNNNRYFLYKISDIGYAGTNSYSAVRKWCEYFGGHLATYTSAAEWNATKAVLAKDSANRVAYIGGKYTADTDWYWLTTEEDWWSAWATNEPGAALLTAATSSGWYDCTFAGVTGVTNNAAYFICEFEPIAVTANVGGTASMQYYTTGFDVTSKDVEEGTTKYSGSYNDSGKWSGTCAYLNSATYPVTLTATPNTGYNFTSWTLGGKYTIVSGELTDTTITIKPMANFTAKASFAKLDTDSYNIHYYVDGALYQTVTCKKGTAITAIAKPTKTGYTFSGWEGLPTTMPENDVTVTGTFTPNNYTITYVVDGATYKTVAYPCGSNITALTAPTKKGYTFSGWRNLPDVMPAYDITVTGSFIANPPEPAKIYFTNNKGWENVMLYYWGTDADPSWPGVEMDYEGQNYLGEDIYSYTLETNAVSGIVFNNGNGEQTVDITDALSNNMGFYLDTQVDGKWTVGVYEYVEYTITYMVDGSTYTTQTYQAGETVVLPAEPTKTGYTFTGWSGIPTTMPENDITITGNFTANTYTVTYIVEGSTYGTQSYKYGTTITPMEEPSKTGYTFTGWSGLPATMPANNITVTASFTIATYTITYKVDGATYKTQSYKYGATVTPLAEPSKTGYTFSGWTGVPTTMPPTDITVTGSFTANTYTVTYIAEGSTYGTQSYKYGTTITPMQGPSKTGYTFTGWSGLPATMPANDITVTASFTVATYTITYKVDGATYKTQSYKYGATVTPLANPSKTGYTFSGWSGLPTVMPPTNVTVTGSFTINTYTLTYVIDGTFYDIQNYKYGEKITQLEAPFKTGYVFSGWSNIPKTMPANNVTVTGSYSDAIYTITYVVDGTNYGTQSYKYGDIVTALKDPTKTGYTFSGWYGVPEVMPPTSVTVTGSFTANTYTITYKVDGATYSTQNFKFGETVTTVAEPSKTGYTFSGWQDVPKTMPANNVTVTGKFTASTYVIVYVVDGTTYGTKSYKYGETVTPLKEPTKDGYVFSGWSGVPETMPANNVTVTGSFAGNTYSITYMVDGSIYSTQSYEVDSAVTALAVPSRTGYTFSGWSGVPATMPANNVTVTGTFTPNTYTITYMIDGRLYSTKKYQYGATVSPLAPPSRTGYTFSGWSLIPATMPAYDVTVTGIFTANTYTVTYIVDGSLYSTQKYKYGEKITALEEPSRTGYKFSGWTGLPEVMPANNVTVYGLFESSNEYELGDSNMDGTVDIRDATVIQLYLSKYIELSDKAIKLCDANGDGTVSVSDVTYVQKKLAGLI